VQRIALLGNHLPRQCGIATFTTHLADALGGLPNGPAISIVAMNDGTNDYAYPERVRFTIAEDDPESYRRAADFLNVAQLDALCLQHEYGIFGGKAGAHVLPLLRRLRMPIVTTLHTVLSAPSPAQQAVIEELGRLSDRLVVMSAVGRDLLVQAYGCDPARIDLVPHGIPCVPGGPASKARLGVVGKIVILTFGLLSRDKGVDVAIEAMPAILAAHPETVYIVLGATHPHVLEHEGEAYRLTLERRGRQLGLGDALIFHDRFVSQDELNAFLAAADIYVTPYQQAEQITSGTLAYAVGAGKAVVSTPYTYARELLADGRGCLVPWRDPAAMAAAVVTLIGDEDGRRAMGARAAAFGAGMTWPVVAGQYANSLARAAADRRSTRASRSAGQTLEAGQLSLPELRLDHLQAMTDDTGLLQHAVFAVPRYEDGYCLDDNARALLLMTLLADVRGADAQTVRTLASRYLAFVSFAFDRRSAQFRNFLTYGRQWAESCGSADSHGRAIWALGTVVGRSRDPGREGLAGELFHAGLASASSFPSPRSWAYALLGIDEYLRAFAGDSAVEAGRLELAERLLARFDEASDRDWPWFEDSVTYCNARLPQALIVSGERLARADMVAVGLRSLAWLMDLQQAGDHFAPIGSNGFLRRGGPQAAFDQQPVEVCAAISACLAAARVSGDPAWSVQARRAFEWFLGANHLQQWLVDPVSGGCLDGLHAERPNLNQGAEATLSFLLSLHEMRTSVDEVHATAAPAEQLTTT
jgi:glycosyltransferase involved in cell wall biosynthesis